MNQLLFGGLELSIFLLEYVCVTCKCNYQRVQRDQLGRSITNTYNRIFEYYATFGMNDNVLNLLNDKLDSALNRVLQPVFWNELSAQLQNSVARTIHAIYGLRCNDTTGNVPGIFALRNKTLRKIVSIQRISGDCKVLPRKKFLRCIKKYTASLS